MKSGRVFFTCVSGAALAWLGCSSGDTIVALNVNVGSGVGDVSKLHVEIDQAGQSPFQQDISMLPKTIVDASDGAPQMVSLMSGNLPPVRLTLPSSWMSGDAKVHVTAFDTNNQPDPNLIAPVIDVQIVAQGVVAAYVNLALPMPDAGAPDGGAEGGGEDGGPADAGRGEAGPGEAAAEAGPDATSADAGADARPADAASDGG